jgi:hypothetical protein
MGAYGVKAVRLKSLVLLDDKVAAVKEKESSETRRRGE